MKITRRQLRSVIKEQSNPGSKFTAAAEKGDKASREKQIDRISKELQKTVDWFDAIVFPAIEKNAWPIKVDDNYYFSMEVGNGQDDLSLDKGQSIQNIHTLLDCSSSAEDLKYRIGDIYQRMEGEVIDNHTGVHMQSDAGKVLTDTEKKTRERKSSAGTISESIKITRRQLREMLAEATQMSAMRRHDEQSEYLGMLAHGLVLGAETIFGIDLSEADEYEYGQDFRAILEKYPDILNRLGEIYMEIRLGPVQPEGPAMTSDEVLDLVVDNFRTAGRGELTEEEFLEAVDDIINSYDFVTAESLEAMGVTYDKALRKVSEIESKGMSR
jgi:hypothetical protein